ncbi:MAG: hypothetical protein KI791_07070 [Cyclobacteriaceae bacterium]|nr:hypothetical protein [Cyclobacteriaceae bacterium SS2]
MFTSKNIVRFLAILTIASSCGTQSGPKDETEIQYSPEIAKIISRATAGSILPESIIEIQFNDDVVSQELLNKEIDSPIKFDPGIKGKAYWATESRLVFEPAELLKSRVNYQAQLNLKAVSESFEVDVFDFKFYVDGRELISFNGELELMNPSNPEQLVYSGKVVFSQKTSMEDVKKAASFSSSKLTWSQEGDNTFSFVSEMLKRESNTKTYQFTLDADDLDMESNLERTVKVVPLKSMELVEVERNESGNKPQMTLKFSDQLDKDQNIDGFVTIKPSVDVTTQKMGKFIILNGDFKFGTTYTVQLQPGLKSQWGTKTENLVSREVKFSDILPQVRFASQGIFIPTTNDKRLQFLTANLERVHVEIKKVFNENMDEFFRYEQLNSAKDRNSDFSNDYVSNVGAIIYNQTLEIGDKKNEWLLHNLDLSKVFDTYDYGLFLVRINFNPRDTSVPIEKSVLGYIQQKGQVYKPLTISDIGLMAKYTDESYTVFTTDLKTGQPMSGVKVTSFRYDEHDSGVTNSDGVATLRGYSGRYIKAEKGNQISIINPDEMRWNNSGFDVGGISTYDLQTRAYTYTERGVYRPGDSLNLSCIVRFSSGSRSDVPVRLRLFNPEGTMVYETTQNTAKDGFYNFELGTDMNAPTGNWDVQLNIGNKYFHHDLKIETVVANRLKVKVNPSLTTVLPDNKNIQIEVESKFLFGTPSPGLEYEAEVQVFDLSNPFPKFLQYSFRDQMVNFQRARTKIGSGTLDAEGKAKVNWNIPNLRSASTPIKAKLLATVQEDGGRPNDAWTHIDIHPFTHYVGIDDSDRYVKLNSRTDIPVVVVDHKGEAVAGRELVYRIYRNDSHWWYQYNSYRDFKLRYKTDTHTLLVEEGTISSGKPLTNLPFQPAQQGQYLVEVQDAVHLGHTSSIFLSAYPFGAIPSGDQNAGTLVLKSEKEQYEVGQEAKISFPSPIQGNVLLTIEQGDKILSHKWIKPSESEDMTISFPVTSAMAPNVYATVSVLQPHSQTVNDRPIRMFGILPIKVFNPNTKDELIINMPDELRPKQKFDVNIATSSGKPTQFTVAVVDEGLLDLTNFQTPNPWAAFFKKIRLDISTYDMFGFVIGANEDDVFKTFSIGGDGDYRESQVDPFEQKKRFKPVCMFKGPVTTDGSGKAKISFEMPNYVGSVRVMVVSAQGDRYGSAEKTVPVKSDLIVLPTVPRALKPGDVFKIPVNVFATRANIGAVDISIQTEGPLEVQGTSSHSHTFNAESDQMFYFNVKVKEAIGQSRIVITAKGKDAESLYEADVAVSPGASRIYETEEKTIEPGQTITFNMPKLGLDGTNNARLHLAVFPNLDFIHRLQWLIQYPYGCIEQTTSSAYPQLAMKDLLTSDPKLFREIDGNINAAIARLSLFQLSNGGFSYWPGGHEVSEWGTNYAGQFLIDANRQGYAVPESMLDGVISYLERKSRQPKTDPRYLMTRVNRCFILAMANEANLSEMNLLKQNYYDKMSNVMKWQLVTAYKLAGAFDKVQADVDQISKDVPEYYEFSHTYGSSYRDLGIILRCLVELEREEDAALMAKSLAEQLSSRRWYSTQTLAQMLLGMGAYFDYAGIVPDVDLVIEGTMTLPDGTKEPFKDANKIAKYINSGYGGQLKVQLNADVQVPKLYATLSSNGVPLIDQSKDEDKNLKVDISWFDEEGNGIDITNVKQGDVFYGRYQVSNISAVPNIDEVALVQMLPSGWEIENTRLSGEMLPGWMSGYKTGREEYLDIRDDRIMWFFDLDKQRLDFIVKINAITEGTYTLPGAVCEAMYNSDYQSTRKAQKVVVRAK